MTTDSVSVSYVSDCEKSGGELMDTSKSVLSMNWDTVKKLHLNPPKIQLPREDSVIQRYKENMSIIKDSNFFAICSNKYLLFISDEGDFIVLQFNFLLIKSTLSKSNAAHKNPIFFFLQYW